MNEKADADAKVREELAARERIRYQWMLDSVSRFRFFFAALVFAMLSFSIQFAIQTTDRVVPATGRTSLVRGKCPVWPALIPG